jgi:hypothetical protein
MLTLSQYEYLWTAPAPNGFGQPLATIPDYGYYLIRENMFEDYLDIFRGVDTRHTRLGIHHVVMPYDHPYTNIINDIRNGRIEKPCIKYILIAEAAPPFKSRRITMVGGIMEDRENSYFYSIIDTKTTSYFKAPVIAFGVGGLTKVEKLQNLAMAGVVLIDILPFAHSYDSDFRENSLTTGLLNNFWHGTHPETLTNRISNLLSPFFCNRPNYPKAALIAPPIISHGIAENLNRGLYPLIPGVNINLNLNQFGPMGGPLLPGIPAVSPSHNRYFFDWPVETYLNGLYLRGITMAPKYRCCAYGPSMLVPHETLIRNALH